MKISNRFHEFAVSQKKHERDRLFIDEWLGPVVACLALLAISASIVMVLFGEQ